MMRLWLFAFLFTACSAFGHSERVSVHIKAAPGVFGLLPVYRCSGLMLAPPLCFAPPVIRDLPVVRFPRHSPVHPLLVK